MGVIYIGDREAGKTHLAMELANPNNQFAKVSNVDYEVLKSTLYDEGAQATRPTEAISPVYDRFLEVDIKLRSGPKQITVDWIDTPGEIWRQSWQNDNPDAWEQFLKTARESEGILLILPPYRSILKPGVDSELFITRAQWCNRFQRWVSFFKQECPRARHILVCLSKADLIRDTDIDKEGFKLAYDPNGSQMNWQQRHDYVLNRYFRPIQPQLEEISRNTAGLSVRCFVTSIYNRSLIELPWIYLGSFLTS